MITQWFELSMEEEREQDLAAVKARPGVWAAVDDGGFLYPETIRWWQNHGCQTDERPPGGGMFVVMWPGDTA